MSVWAQRVWMTEEREVDQADLRWGTTPDEAVMIYAELKRDMFGHSRKLAISVRDENGGLHEYIIALVPVLTLREESCAYTRAL